MGGFVAAALAEREPELVAGLVLIEGGYAPTMPLSGSQPDLDAALAVRINQLRQSYPSREAYRQFWRTQPHFPPEVWGPWIGAFLDYEIEGEPPALRPRAFEQGVRTDLMEGLDRERIVQRCRGIRVPVLLVRAPAGFVPGTPPLFPDAVVEQMRSCIPQMEDHIIPDSTHYTIIMGSRGATAIADLIDRFAARCQRTPEANPA
jgi:pimeloyl-ACP methyl ester carboxylesterase